MQQISMPKPTQLQAVADELKTSRWFWCFAAVFLIGVRHFLGDGAQPIGPTFGDTDDALRLVQIREFLATGNWYDTRLAAIGAPEALNSHWSRLIDLPVALLISVFAVFISYANAETLAQIVWPTLLLLALARLLSFEAERRSGSPAALAVLGLLVLTPSGIFQFLPGRIDHHNVQILCAIGGILLLQRAITQPAAGWWAGGLMALGLAVGLEALPLVAATLGLACLLACFDVNAREGACRALISLAVGLLVAYVVTTHPAHWLQVACDALGPNLLLLCGSGAVAAYVLKSRFARAPAAIWICSFAAAGIVGVGAYFAANPTCAGGAFAGMDETVRTQWLAKVVESKSLFEFAFIHPSAALSFVAVTVIALTLLTRQMFATRSANDGFMAASTLLACLYGFYYIKLMPYGILLAIVPIACWIARLPARAEISALSVRLGVVFVTSQMFLGVIAGLTIGLFSDIEASAKEKMSSGVASCKVKSDLAALSTLPPGLVISDLDLGPFIAVSTKHRAYAGPYHRIHKSIGDLIALQTAPLSDAGAQLTKMNADYLVLCAVPPKTDSKKAAKETFSTHLRNGGDFKGLEPVSIGKTKGPLRVWKIVKAPK